MTTLYIPPFLLKEAEALGAKINPKIEFDPETALVKLSQFYNGQEPDFGAEDSDMGCDCASFAGFKLPGFMRKTLQKVTKNKVKIPKNATVNVNKSLKGLAKGVGIGAAAVSMAVPGVNILTGSAVVGALATADKLLGDKNVKNAARVISNTKAMAALGDPAAKRATVVLGTVAQIRAAKKTPLGQRAIPFNGKVKTKPFVQYVPKQYANTLAVKKVEQAKTSKKKTFWMKVKEFFGAKPTVNVGCCT